MITLRWTKPKRVLIQEGFKGDIKMVSDSEIAELINNMAVVVGALRSAKRTANAEFLDSIWQLVQYYFHNSSMGTTIFPATHSRTLKDPRRRLRENESRGQQQHSYIIPVEHKMLGTNRVPEIFSAAIHGEATTKE